MYYRKNSLRLKNFNYRKPCFYFITVCVNQQLCLFGKVMDKKLELNNAGKMIAKVFVNLPKYFNNTIIDTYIVMPNHFHGILSLDYAAGASLCGRPQLKTDIWPENKVDLAPSGLSVSEIIGRFKSFTTIQYINGVENQSWKPFYEKLWQRGYYDRVVRNKKELFAMRKYICNNPLKWKS